MSFLSIFLLLTSPLWTIQAEDTTLTEEERHQILSWEDCISKNTTRVIIGGEDVNITEVPFQIQIEVLIPTGWIFNCGGSIISKNIVLTAAHCIAHRPLPNIRVRSGSTIRGKGNMHNIIEGIIHLGFDHPAYSNDIGILKVTPPFTFSIFVKPIRVAFTNPEDGLETMTSGWGNTIEIEEIESPSDKLKRITLPILNRRICNMVSKKEEDYQYIDQSKLCAGTPAMEEDACKGDSGGPLYFNNVVYGIVSYGYACARACTPKIFTSVAYFVDWIHFQASKIEAGNSLAYEG